MWNETRVELLRKLWADGLSAGMIAAELGGMTRNAVIGKAHRLGLSGRQKGNPEGVNQNTTPRRRHRKAKPDYSFRSARSATMGGGALASHVGEPKPAVLPKLTIDTDDNIIPIGQRCSILELCGDKCHFPFGDPIGTWDREAQTFKTDTFFFCGGPAVTGLPYCGYHARICYQPTPERRSRAVQTRADRDRVSQQIAAKYGASTYDGRTHTDQMLETLDGSKREGTRRPYECASDGTET